MMMSDNIQPNQNKKPNAAKNDKNMKRYSEKEKALLYELFERHQEIIDIKLRRNLYSSTKQCEVRECWELILKTFNDNPHTSERTMKQLQKFWLNAKLRRMFPYDKSQTEINSRRTSIDSKALLKIKQPHERNKIENIDSDDQHPEEIIESEQDCERERKPQIFEINYVVPSNLIIREHQTQHTQESSAVFEENLRVPDVCEPTNNQHTNESEPDQHMQDDSDEVVVGDHENSLSISDQQKMDNLRLQEMENRVCESQLRCEVQRLLISKAAEECKHQQEMNKIQLQEAKIRLRMLERNCSNGRGNSVLFDAI